MAGSDADAPDPDEGPSRSQRKRDAAELTRLGAELVALPAAELAALPLPERLRDAIELARRITAHGGAARQRQYIGKLLRKTEIEPLRALLARRDTERRLAAREFHRIETWRDRLLADGEPALDALLASAPRLDRARLAALLADARREAGGGAPPHAARELFRYLREAMAAPRRDPQAGARRPGKTA